MSTSDFTLAFILLFTLQGCTAQVCKTYEDSGIKDDCDELIIGGGTVCYIYKRWNRWDANITCLEGYDLLGTPTRFCNRYWGWTWIWTWDESQTHCVREQRSTTSQTSVSEKRGSLFVVYITVPTVAIVIIVFVLVVFFYRIRKLAENVRSRNQKDRTSAVTNNAYDDNAYARDNNSTPPGRVDNNDSEYFTIPDSVDQNTGGSEYSTLHMDERGYNTQNDNHLPLRSDTYDHTTSTVGNVQKMTDTYSHLNDASHDNNSKDWNKETRDVYNKLGADGQCVKSTELEHASTESDYDRTNTCSEKPAILELDTYSSVNNELGVNDDDSQKYHNYFVLEKN